MPNCESFRMSLRLVMPLIRETATSGTAIRRSSRMKMLPHGLIQSCMIVSQPDPTAINPNTMPKTIPMRIVIYSGILFIL